MNSCSPPATNALWVALVALPCTFIFKKKAWYRINMHSSGVTKLLYLITLLLFPLSRIKAQEETNFIIGVTGGAALYEELKKDISGKMVGSQKIVIKTLSPSAASFDCHMLFIGEEETGSMKKIVSSTANTSTLLVTRLEGRAQKGICINFVIIPDHLKLEIYKNNVGQRELNIASELMQPGKVVQ